jgi:PAS domain S-box-containing protein
MIISEANGNQLVAFSPIGITMGSEQFGFGGKQGSVDHIKGNKGEAWHVVISLSEEKAIKTADEITVVIVIVGIIFTFLTATVSLFLGKWIARPIVELAITAQTIGEGNLEARTGVHSNDEIGRLATTFNNMASKRKQAESALRESENRVRDISLSMADWIWEVDKNGKYTFVSDTVKNVLGYSSDELIGKEPFELMSSEEGDRIKAIFLETVSRSGPIHDLENWNLAKDGTEVCFLTNGVQIFNADRELQGYRGVNKDITHQKKIEAEKASIEDQLRQAQKMESVGRLAGGVAHDYNNALTVILGFTELAMGTMDSNESIYDDLNQVLKAARQAADITRQLLAFARKQTIAPEVLDLNENVKTVLKMLQRLIGEDISLAWLPGANLWSVKIDPSQIDQIMANLCVNARDAISGVGKITIETGTVVLDTAYCVDHYGFIPGAFVILSVSDDGCGIDSEILNNIFEPFFTTKPADKGTGLGLATVYGIVKQNNGFISVYSEPGEGTTIRIYLPRHEGNAVPIQRESTEEIPSGHGETILIVEDDLMILKVTKKILDELGYSVLTASTPEEAMGVLKKFPEEIYLLLTDVVMPGMNGRKLSERLQSICPDLKCVFMSGYTANAIAQHGVLDQGLFFIQKPFSKLNLAKIVRKALDA